LAGDYAAVTHSNAVGDQLEALMNRFTDGETGERGFLLTGSENYLEQRPLLTARKTNSVPLSICAAPAAWMPPAHPRHSIWATPCATAYALSSTYYMQSKPYD
jgi:CHASE3 domain